MENFIFCAVYVHKIFQKAKVSYRKKHAHTSAYQGVRNVSFSENFVYVLNEGEAFLRPSETYLNTV